MDTLIFYFIIFTFLLLCELVYFRIARHYNIGDNVTHRSSHEGYQLTGGGIIFIISAIIFWIWYSIWQQAPPIPHFSTMMKIALGLAILSFIDDIKELSPIIRLICHVIAIAVTFYYIFEHGYIDIYILVLIGGVGLINAYNFMDGINGITAGYSIITLCTLLYCYIVTPGIPIEFILSLLIATVIFTFFNFRKNAVCFSGDVGAIVMGFFILFLTVELILQRNDATPIVFLIVYGIDSVYTIFQRLFMGENIFLPHRHHLYQVFANQWAIPHYKVSLGYCTTQLVVNVLYFFIPEDYKWTYVIILVILLSIIYFVAKRSPLSRSN
jgi:UDP-N-acetylmuramyl pentapeptide phosphotransferase/UDP-N-acetylglucosamine-1-phosphate transferase